MKALEKIAFAMFDGIALACVFALAKFVFGIAFS